VAVVVRALEALLPADLGRDFRFLWSAATLTNLADGVLLAAGPLLVASLTREPFAVAMAVFAQRIPWVLFGVVAGAIIDRVDRRRLLITVNALRVVVAGLLGLAIAVDATTLAVVYLALFLLGTAETFADNAKTVAIAVVVPRAGLGRANARLYGSGIVGNQLAGPPLGALLFGLGIVLPFALNALLLLAAVLLLVPIRLPRSATAGPRQLRHEVAEGLRWLWSNAPVRTLAILITVFNVTFGAAFSVWVLYALERLGLSEVGFGLLMTASALGGLVGTASYGTLEQRFGYATLLRVGLVVECLTHLVLALTRSPAVAGLVMAAFGMHAVVWGTTSTTVRQRVVPALLLGRVTSVYMIGSVGALSLGTLLGGAIAQRYGILAPFVFAAIGATATTAVVWRSIGNIAAAADAAEPASGP
jgi:MFS family permease